MQFSSELIVQQPPPTPAKKPDPESSSVQMKGGCISAGSAKMTTQIQKNIYRQGDQMKVQVTVDNSKSSIESINVLSWISQDFIISLDPAGPVETYVSDDTQIRKAKWRDLKKEHMRDDYEKSSRYVSTSFLLNNFVSKRTTMLRRNL